MGANRISYPRSDECWIWAHSENQYKIPLLDNIIGYVTTVCFSDLEFFWK
jgi:hypothetical protein